MLPNVGTSGSQFYKLTVPKPRNQCFPILEPMFPDLGTSDLLQQLHISMRLTICLEFWHQFYSRTTLQKGFNIGIRFNIHVGNMFLLFSLMVRQKMHLHSVLLLIKRWHQCSQSWNHGFPNFNFNNYVWRGCNIGIRFNLHVCNTFLLFCLMVRQKMHLHSIFFLIERSHLCSQSWNHRFPIRRTLVPKNNQFPVQGTSSSHMCQQWFGILEPRGAQFQELAVPKPSHTCFPILEPRVPSSRN